MFSDTFFQSFGDGECCGKNWPTEVVEIATLNEFDENNIFFTNSCDPDMAHTLKLFYTFHHKKDTKDSF
jgi:hypothetical protein